ncbi:MAG: hypothetical protein WA416_13100 [Candidatus Sulfotelmatobacter sp.]
MQPVNYKPLNQMQDEKNGEYVSCESTIDYETSKELGFDRIAHDVLANALKTQKEHDAEEIKASRYHALEGRTVMTEHIYTVLCRSNVVRAQIPD